MAEQVDDNAFQCKYSHSFDNEIDSRDYKYPSVAAQIRQLKQSCECWKEILLFTKNVFLWEKQWYSTALISGSTLCFMFLWLLDPTVLTVVSLLGLLVTVCDYVVPSVANSLSKPETWTATKDQEFEDLCTDIVLYRAKLELAWASYYRLKATNRKMYFMMTVLSLSALAWIGCAFNNLFLTYVLATCLLLLPGLKHNGTVAKWNGYARRALNELLKKSGQEKKD